MVSKESKEVKAGNVKKALVSGVPYIMEFVSSNRARAYTRKKNNEGKIVKDAYAGQFNAGPPPTINANIKEENVKASPTNNKKQNNIKPTNIKPTNIKPTNTKKNNKKVTVAKRTVKTVTKPTPPPVPTYTGYFQKQEGLGCGRHALNNLLGRQAFQKGASTDFYVEGATAEPYSLLGICNTIEAVFKKKGLKQSCLSSENYDNNTMIAALDVLGYDNETLHPTDVIDESGDYLGFLINLGVIKGKPKHWVALKFKRRDDTDTVYYDYFDSLNTGPVENITYETFAAQHPQTFIIKVLLPRHASVDPRERIELLANAAPPSPKVTKTTVKKTTECTTLYDPCTKAPLKDLAALEARVAELKAKVKV